MEFKTDSFAVFDQKWALLTAGTPEHCNPMTISWGGLGTLWGKPVATVYVRHNRHTFGFMEEEDYFTLSFYKEDYRKMLQFMGSRSGRNCDKIKETGLTPKFIDDKAVTFTEAETTLVCKKLYAQDLNPKAMPKEIFESCYQFDSIHRMYIAEVIAVL
ncbi:MAG TPA: flavin reductase [Clostridiales bacterium]|nr:flavin reductase [Clostridiales bacterium]